MTRALAAVGAAVLISISILPTGEAVAAPGKQKPGGGQVAVPSIACPSAGNCVAVGYLQPPGENLAFATSETDGTWRPAENVPGLSALPGGSLRAALKSVSCPATGTCTAGGFYVDHAKNAQAFVVSEKGGTWGKAKEVPGTAALNVGGKATISLLSCRSAGNCTAAGTYSAEMDDSSQAFVVSEKDGRWGAAEEIPGLAALDGSFADVNALSCSAPGDCTVGGDYDSARGTEPFVVTQRRGAWGQLQPFPPIEGVNTAGVSSINVLVCRSVGICTASGTYRTADHHDHVFLLSERNGVWGGARPIPGIADLPHGGEVNATIDNLECPSAGNCTVGGTYSNGTLLALPFIATEKNGTWDKARTLPGVEELGQGLLADLTSLSCPGVGNCTATGDYTSNATTFSELTYVISEKDGRWAKAKTLPGATALSRHGELGPEALSCGAPGDCAVGGIYFVANGLEAPFVATEKNGTWSNAERLPGT